MNTPASIAAALAAPFEPHEVKYKPGIVHGARCLAMAYVDVRTVMDRLDSVVGVAGWSDAYDLQADGSVLCRLSVCLDGVWITKSDVGSPSAQPDAGDRRKAAVSDALKRAAVHFGIARYLYRAEPQWCAYDATRKRIVGKASAPASTPPAPAAPRTAQDSRGERPAVALPADGAELAARVQACDRQLAADGRIAAGELLAHLSREGRKAGYPARLADWSGEAIAFAAEETTRFIAARQHQKAVA